MSGDKRRKENIEDKKIMLFCEKTEFSLSANFHFLHNETVPAMIAIILKKERRLWGKRTEIITLKFISQTEL